MEPWISVAGLVISTLAIVFTINASSRKQAERQAITETRVDGLQQLLEQRMGFIETAVTDLKKSAGLTRRCTDCQRGLGDE